LNCCYLGDHHGWVHRFRPEPHQSKPLMMMIMLTGWEYVPEMRPPTGILFIPQVIYEHGRTMVEWCPQRKTPDPSSRALRQSYQQSHLVANQELGEGNCEFSLRIIFVYTWKCFLHRPTVKSYMGPTALLPIWRRRAAVFFCRSWKPIASAVIELCDCSDWTTASSLGFFVLAVECQAIDSH
jgi:hypothetical protein